MPLLLTGAEPDDPRRSSPKAYSTFTGLDDPALAAYLGGGAETAAGVRVGGWDALANTAVFRSVSLISNAIGMLPLHLQDAETKKKATSHPLYNLLHREPNNWQSAFDFRSNMQLRALVKGNGYARIIWGTGLNKGKVLRLVPMDPALTMPVQNSDWSVSYKYTPPAGGQMTLDPADVFHLRGLSIDGIRGISLVLVAREAIALALQAERATARIFKRGTFVDGVLQTDKALGEEAFGRLRNDWDTRYGGADNAGKTPILEDGLKYASIASTPKDAQSLETRKLQIEEIARVFGVPRPLLMVDETSWGSGVEALGRFFVQYALITWFRSWEESISRSLLIGSDKEQFVARFDPKALLRGSMADQATFFSKALGTGGQQPWMVPNEVRDEFDMPAHPDGNELFNPMSETGPAKPDQEPTDDAPPAADPAEDGKTKLRVV